MKENNFEKELSQDTLLEETEKLRHATGAGYVKKEDKYNDLNSSAITFLCFGIIGLIIVLLNYLDIFTLPWLGNSFSEIILMILFIAFIVLGISSFISANKIKQQIGDETSLTNSIHEWLTEHVSEEDIRQLDDPEQSAEVNYFAKTEAMKQMVMETFPDTETSLVDFIVDEFYSKHFEP